MEKEQPSSEMIAQVLLTQEILDLRMDLNKHRETMNELIKNQKKELQSVTDVTETKKHTQKKDKDSLRIWLFFLIIILGGISYFSYWLITSIHTLTETSKSDFIAEFGTEKGTHLWGYFSDIIKHFFNFVPFIFFIIGISSKFIFSEIYKTAVRLYIKNK